MGCKPSKLDKNVEDPRKGPQTSNGTHRSRGGASQEDESTTAGRQNDSGAGSSLGAPNNPPKIPSGRFIDQISKQTLSHTRVKKGADLFEYYELDEQILGTGISGAVRVGRHRESGKSYAIKTLSTQNISPKKASMLYNEVSVYLSLDHPNIAKLFEVYEDDRAVHLVMELCTGKELYDRLACKKRYVEKDAAYVAHQMLSAINYCHKHKICHRDLKLENWVYATPAEDAPLKLIDFGFSRIFNPGVPMTAMHGTVYYVSPEVMDGAYNEECDIWSIGVIVFMLLSGSPPFNGTQDHEILAKIKRAVFSFEGPRWEGISQDAKNFISALLKKNPDERPSAEKALKHKWFECLKTNDDHEIDLNVLKNMQKFAAFNGMKRAALGVIALSMNSDEVEELEKIFLKLDREKNGTILLHELKDAMTEVLKIPEAEARKVFQKMDVTGDHEVHYSEFLAATMQAKFVLQESMIRDAFQRFDVDKTGYISAENLREVLGDTFDGTRIEDIIHACDYKKNGRIDYDEFLQALTSDDVVSVMGMDESPATHAASIAQQERDMGVLRKVSKSLLELSEHPERHLVVPKMDED
ncbi:unnamed protein product [Vitrella brassicaformis CCMP3155]|uniref:non-specific serine/threonine protein kinase n=1 Tax=Vitrella brassicaformis (strain CCMP3155) TaxID=1169540 RepID=A0A0G4EJK3_VITBC|nr:unnamed protein product [Vitrella brassicaformis CCMP3155]|mmetsp:Transcript_35761/g.89021  ORF Transcript_35761/g.89021 Transcript_35761/m.89021 type:complete len:583 (-) Transcript_35761:859-2607(-)|eukprot:CEL97359.1 unnamed protein product [Vitrella brassicaformis CCMP3155]